MTTVVSGARIYTVVEVMRGLAADAHIFRHFKDARQCAEHLRRDRNLDEDDVQIFENLIDYCRSEK